MKGIILAGGSGTRLYPVTQAVSKHILPIYDKPMIYYPLSTLMLAGIRDILLISTPQDQPLYQRLFGDGSEFGLRIDYAIQEHPNGLAEALIIARDYLDGDTACLVLGDNIFYGQGFSQKLLSARRRVREEGGAVVFGYQVKDPQRFGVVAIDENQKAISIQEKPEKAPSNYAVTGLYFYDPKAVDIAASVAPSERGELEITSVNADYLARGELHVEILGRGFTWFDTGTHESFLEASLFVETIERLQSFKIACLEEIAFAQGWIDRSTMAARAELFRKNGYGAYLSTFLD